MSRDIDTYTKYKEDPSEGKLISLWLLASLFFFAGSWIAGHVEHVFGTTPFSFYFSLFLSYTLFLIASFIVIVIAVSVAQNR